MGLATEIPGFLFFDHVAVSVKLGDLEKQVAVYKAMKFKEIHRDDVQIRCVKYCCAWAMGRT